MKFEHLCNAVRAANREFKSWSGEDLKIFYISNEVFDAVAKSERPKDWVKVKDLPNGAFEIDMGCHAFEIDGVLVLPQRHWDGLLDDVSKYLQLKRSLRDA
jgi:hypothetical protein